MFKRVLVDFLFRRLHKALLRIAIARVTQS
jgi:hypothetical protein